jgi:polysaccharide export outer membrane protein
MLASCATLLFSLTACAPYVDLPPGACKLVIAPVSSAVTEQQVVSVPTLPVEPAPSPDYIIGPNDVLLINVNGKSEFTTQSTSGAGKVSGSRVDGSGSVQIPLAGSVPVAGSTVPQAQARIAEALRKYLKEPWVVVEVAEFRSHPYYLLGSFRNFGTAYMDRPLTLLQGIAQGGFDPSAANIRGARLIRNGAIQPVDVYDLLTRGDNSQNIWLKTGDTLYLPDNSTRLVFIFGAVKKPGPVPMPSGGLSLAQAIASAELRDTGYDFTRVRIIRSLSTTRGELLVVDFDKVLRGEALPLQLMEGDIVYVPRSNFGTWNDVLAEIVPSLQAVSAALQPFVNIKFLTTR